MQHGLAAPVRARTIIRRADFRRGDTGHAAFVRNTRLAYGTAHASDLSRLAYRRYDVPTRFTTCQTHLLDSISDRNFLIFHIPSFALNALKSSCPLPETERMRFRSVIGAV